MTYYALIGASCLADGHPTSCQEPAPGSLVNVDSNAPITLDGTVVADHGDKMHYDSHAHDYSSKEGCHDYQSHDLVPDQTPPWTVDGRPLVLVGNDTTDPGSGGRAWVDGAGGNSAFELVD